MRALLAVALAGCSQWFGLDHPDLLDGNVPPIDGASVCLGQGGFRYCAAPTGPLDLPNEIDTSACSTLDATHEMPGGGGKVCVLAGTTIRGTDEIRVRGMYPLVLFATGEIRIEGVLDVASHRGEPAGPGANAVQCIAAGDGNANVNGGGGGGGGGFGSNGGGGGRGAGTSAPGSPGGAAGATTPRPEYLRGGCRGGLGAGGSMPSEAPGDGGGAVLLLAGASMQIEAINASGAGGGNGRASKGGGGGGGSGGLIALDAPTIQLDGYLMANGGGGGGGADNGALGVPGSDPMDAKNVAPGGLGGGSVGCGTGPGCGGDGAIGGVAARAGGDDATGAGGGGGGGGVGYILVLSGQKLAGTISPASN